MPTPKPAPMPELLPCPLCGSAEIYPPSQSYYGIYCHACGCCTKEAASESKAIAAWNQRAPSPVNAALLSALRDLVAMNKKVLAVVPAFLDALGVNEDDEEWIPILRAKNKAARAAIRDAEATK